MSNEIILKEREISLVSGLFLMFFNIHKSNKYSKRLRKRLTTNAKKLIATSKTKYHSDGEYYKWLYYVNVSNKIILDARDETVGKDNPLHVNPALILRTLYKRFPKILDYIKFSEEDLSTLTTDYKSLNVSFMTIKYVNRFIKALDNIKYYETLSEEERIKYRNV